MDSRQPDTTRNLQRVDVCSCKNCPRTLLPIVSIPGIRRYFCFTLLARPAFRNFTREFTRFPIQNSFRFYRALVPTVCGRSVPVVKEICSFIPLFTPFHQVFARGRSVDDGKITFRDFEISLRPSTRQWYGYLQCKITGK